MKTYKTYSAESIKCQLIDFFLTKYSEEFFIGNEIMYGTNRKLIDLLVIHQNKLIAIEIKADNDDFRRLEVQIEESRKNFDNVIVCTTLLHLDRMIELLPNDVGIYITTGENIKIVRKPLKQKKMDKKEVLNSMNSSFLKRVKDVGLKNNNSDEIRNLYLRKSKSTIHDLYVEYLKLKIKNKFSLFMKNRGELTHIDDIPLLSSLLDIQ